MRAKSGIVRERGFEWRRGFLGFFIEVREGTWWGFWTKRRVVGEKERHGIG